MNVIKAIKQAYGKEYARNYENSASFFNAIIESTVKHGFFIESSQYEDLRGNRPFPREYALKVIGVNHVHNVKQFKTRYQAFKFFETMEFINGCLVIDRFVTPGRSDFNRYLLAVNTDKPLTKSYDDGLSAFYHCEPLNYAISYYEGDCVEFSTVNGHSGLVDAHVKFYKEDV